MYQLFCDSNSEIPYWFADENGLKVVSMPYVLDDKEYYYDLGRNTDFKHFFQREREGSMPTTAALNVENYLEIYEPTLKEGTDILMISFSSALSGTHESLEQARLQLLEKYPERSFKVVNTLGISMGAGLLVYYATKMWKDGASQEKIIKWVEDNRQKVHHWFTVNDLNHLKRGGRLSGAAAFMGTMLDIKPIITVNSEGKLVVFEKAKGRKKSLKALAEKFNEYVEKPEEQLVVVLHGDAEEDGQYLVDLIKEMCTPKEIWLNYVGPVIGTHCGPGTIGLLFMGKERIK